MLCFQDGFLKLVDLLDGYSEAAPYILSPSLQIELLLELSEVILDVVLANKSLQIEQIAAVLVNSCEHIIICELRRSLEMLLTEIPQLCSESAEPVIE